VWAVRLDQLLVERGLFASREKAHRAVMAGQVEVNGVRVDKPGSPMRDDVRLELTGTAEPFVSRAGGKLAAALDHFAVDPAGWRCLDVGASTGGFSDCLLQRGAAHIVAVDVGYGLLDLKVRDDPRVEVRERVNARYLAADAFDRPFDLVVVDVSFISLTKVVPALVAHLKPGGLLLPLIKPQFEVGRGGVGKGGLVRDEALRRTTIDCRAGELAALGFDLVGTYDSPVAGAEGNREAFALLRRKAPADAPGVPEASASPLTPIQNQEPQ
jgi:23S rRNA (cytidine1920-2'-O)/16S rRNA (cytidine1409-2'-O)-methyltransferase